MPGTSSWQLRDSEQIIACNTSLLGHIDRLNPTRLPGPCCCGRRAASSPSASLLHDLLQSGSDAPVGQQGCAVTAHYSCRWPHCADAIPRRTSPSVCASLISDRHTSSPRKTSRLSKIRCESQKANGSPGVCQSYFGIAGARRLSAAAPDHGGSRGMVLHAVLCVQHVPGSSGTQIGCC
jgi:hypothetical protein